MRTEINHFLKNPTFLERFTEINEGSQLFSFKTEKRFNLTYVNKLCKELLAEYGKLADIMKVDNVDPKELISAFEVIDIPAIVPTDDGNSFVIKFYVERR